MSDMEKSIEVSIICMAYNQKRYIAEALESMLSQKTSFDYEIVVHDDMSTDGTTDIIKRYEQRYPDKIKALYEKENQYSQGVDVFMGICMPQTSGRYIAVCEGDDYWISDDKLQKEYDALEVHTEIDMCACGATELTEGIETGQIRPHTANGVLTTEEVILGGGRYIATATLFFRKALFSSFMEFEKVICFDYSNQIKGALRGGIYYIDEIMAVYRRATENSWTRKIEQNKEKRAEHIKTEIAMLRQLDIDTGGKYHSVIVKRITAYTPFSEQLSQHREEILELTSGLKGNIYLWGLGMRGDAVQEFCHKENIKLTGVCDKKNSDIGSYTAYKFLIVSTGEALENSNVMFVSNSAVYEYLKDAGYEGEMINFQKYMPLS